MKKMFSLILSLAGIFCANAQTASEGGYYLDLQKDNHKYWFTKGENGIYTLTVTKLNSDFKIMVTYNFPTGINETSGDSETPVAVMSITGVVIKESVPKAEATNGLPAGLYIIGNEKVYVR